MIEHLKVFPARKKEASMFFALKMENLIRQDFTLHLKTLLSGQAFTFLHAKPGTSYTADLGQHVFAKGWRCRNSESFRKLEKLFNADVECRCWEGRASKINFKPNPATQ